MPALCPHLVRGNSDLELGPSYAKKPRPYLTVDEQSRVQVKVKYGGQGQAGKWSRRLR